MTPILYDVILTGQIVAGHDPQTVVAALARLMKRDAPTVINLLKRSRPVIKRRVDPRTGQAICKTLKRIGVVSRLVSRPAANDRKTPTGVAPLALDDADHNMRIISPPLQTADVAYAPIQANRITRAPEGLDVNRLDTPPIRFKALVSLCVYQEAETDKIIVLLFHRGQKRPYRCNANRIAYSDFPDTKATSVTASLRHFVRLAGRRHPALRLDPPTAAFLSGRPPAILEFDLVQFTTTMAKALASDGAALPT